MDEDVDWILLFPRWETKSRLSDTSRYYILHR